MFTLSVISLKNCIRAKSNTIFHLWNIISHVTSLLQMAYFSKCVVEKPENFRTSTGFEPVTSRYRWGTLTNSAMEPLILGAGHLRS